MRRLGVIVAALGLLFAWTSAPAQAETNPACATGMTRIGTTGYIEIGGDTFASVKQFVGCGKNWGYVYVWESWRDSHSNWDICAAIAVGRSSFELRGMKCVSNVRSSSLWSYGTDTLSECTHAFGSFYGTNHTGRTDIRC